MSSTQPHSRRESTDITDSVGGDQYTDGDRQQIAAETDAAIANFRPMDSSAFATGHPPDDKTDAAKRMSDHGGNFTHSSSPSSPTIKPKKDMANKALIVSHSWGGPIQGGVTDALHLLIRLLRELGISVYSTTLTATAEEIKEARRYGVELIPPSPIRKFKDRDGTPKGDWLYRHDEYFPNLSELANVRYVFGFGMITSEAAFEIVRDLFPEAAFYLINLFDKDVITPIIANCFDADLHIRRENVLKEGQGSNSVFSVGGSIFRKYKNLYRRDPSIKHYKLSPMVDKKHFQIPCRQPDDEDEDEYDFQILSLFQKHEVDDLTSDSHIVKAMNSVAESFHNFNKPPIKWKILGVPKRRESDLRKQLNPHAALDVVFARMPSAEHLENELCQSHLVLIHPSSVHYVNLTLAAMSAAVPVIVPQRSQSHELIKVHMAEHEDRLVVEMSASDTLQKRIMSFLCNYKITLQRATTIRNAMKSQVKQKLENVNDDFLRVVKAEKEKFSSAKSDDLYRGSMKDPEADLADEQGPKSNSYSSTQDNYTEMGEGHSTLFTSTDGVGSSDSICPDERSHADISVAESDDLCRGSMKDPKADLADEQGPKSNSYSSTQDNYTEMGEGHSTLFTSTDGVGSSDSICPDERSHADKSVAESDDLCRGSMKDSEADVADEQVPESNSYSTTQDNYTEMGEGHSPSCTSIPESNPYSTTQDNYTEMGEGLSTLCTSTESIQVTLEVQDSIPGSGQNMAGVEEQLFDTRQQAEVHEAIRRKLEDVEPDIEVSDPEEGSIRYKVKCKTPKALQGFWRRYQSGELRKIVQDTLITPDVLRKVNAICIRMRVVINYSEYRQALRRLTSRENHDNVQETDTPTQEAKSADPSREKSLGVLVPDENIVSDATIANQATECYKSISEIKLQEYDEEALHEVSSGDHENESASLLQKMNFKQYVKEADRPTEEAESADPSREKTSRLPDGNVIIKLKMQVSEVVPERGRTVEQVERDFYQSEEVKENSKNVGKMLDNLHKDITLQDIRYQSISYLMACRSLDALEYLMARYENGKLQDMMEEAFLSDYLFEKIGAFYLAIDTTIDYEEYLQCRKELFRKYGLPSTDNNLEKDTNVAPSMEAPRMTNTQRRGNKARDLLKIFENDGGEVKESQIIMLDELLREKEKIRHMEHMELEHLKQKSEQMCTLKFQQNTYSDDAESTHITAVHLLGDEKITEKNEELETKISNLRISSKIGRSKYIEKGQGREVLRSMVVEKGRAAERELKPLLSDFLQAKTETRDLVTNHPQVVLKTEKLLAYADHIVDEAEIPKEAKDVYLDVRRVEKGYPVKGKAFDVFTFGSMPGPFNTPWGIYIKKNGQWVICDSVKVQVFDPIKLCCDLILQFHAFPKSFIPWNVTVDEDNDRYYMSDQGNGQVVVSSGQSKMLNCFGRKEGIDPSGICLSPDGFIFLGDMNGYVRKYKKSGEHIERTEKGQVSEPLDLIVKNKYIFVSDNDRQCVHVLNHQMQSIRDIGEGHLERPYGLCFDHQQDGIYVCDIDGNRVVHFKCDGEFLSYKGQGQLKRPRYIALCKDNPYRLVVTQQFYVKLLYI